MCLWANDTRTASAAIIQRLSWQDSRAVLSTTSEETGRETEIITPMLTSHGRFFLPVTVRLFSCPYQHRSHNFHFITNRHLQKWLNFYSIPRIREKIGIQVG